jgi:hypothetical protein
MAYQNLVSQFIYKQPLLRSKFDQLGENDQYLKDNNWQDGVKLVFFSAAVPVGWTQDVSVNDRFLRVVNNVGGNPGGAVGGSLSVAAGINLTHTHTFTSDANHTHTGVKTHATRHGFTSGQGLTGSTVLLSKSPRLYGIGDVVAQFNQNGTSTTGPGNWGQGTARGFAADVAEANASSSAGSHNHTVSTDLGTINPAYADVIIGVKSASSGYTDMTAFFNHNDRIRYEPFGATTGLYGNDVYNQGRLTPHGAMCMFYNAAAPIAWLKFISLNDRALRVVSGAGGGLAGSLGTGQNIVLNHTHTSGLAGSHSHTTGAHRHNVNAATGISARTLIAHPSMNAAAFTGADEARATTFDGGAQAQAVKGRTQMGASGLTTGTQANHNHTISSSLTNIILAYVDVIHCQKIMIGHPYNFQDLTSTVQYKNLVSKQRLDKYAQNDEHIRYHVMPAGSILSFFQSTIPLLWTLVSAQHDKVLRVVSGGGGGSGGNHFISNAINLVHTHPIVSHVHSHSIPSHTHDFDFVASNVGSFISTGVISSGQSHYASIHNNPHSGDIGLSPQNTFALKKQSDAQTAETTDQSHNHGGATSSALSNVTFAYANVILCQKA